MSSLGSQFSESRFSFCARDYYSSDDWRKSLKQSSEFASSLLRCCSGTQVKARE